MTLRSRFEKEPARAVQTYTASIPFDRRLYRYDIAGSEAHARMLAKQGIITEDEARAILRGLERILQEIEEGCFPFKEELEDIHMNIEARLREKIGEVAGRLHTARSRNDQIALDMRLYVKDAVRNAVSALKRYQKALVDLAEANFDVPMPGYTHLQRAQPVLFPHYLLAYFQMAQRDIARFRDCLTRADVMPLGSGALAGVPYPIDRQYVAEELGFGKISQNSIDAVSDRDFVAEYEGAAALAMMHLSRLAEELIIWSSGEFDYVEMDDAYATGSSIMPQKKNPAVAELARAKTGRVYGHLMAMLTILKALPLAYNKDLQEDKEGLFDTVDTLVSSLDVFTGMISALKLHPDRMARAAEENYALATDIADYLVKKGLPFREAHKAVGQVVRYAAEQGKSFRQLSLEEYQQFSPYFGDDMYAIDVVSSLAARDVPGGTAPERVREALADARKALEREYD